MGLFRLCLVSVLCASYIYTGVSFLTLDNSSSLFSLKIWCMPLTWDFPPSPMPINQRVGFFKIVHIFVCKNYYILFSFGLEPPFYSWDLIFCLIYSTHSLFSYPISISFFTSWSTEALSIRNPSQPAHLPSIQRGQEQSKNEALTQQR